MARIDFTSVVDAVARSLASSYPAPANRFQSVLPEPRVVGPRHHPLATKRPVVFRFMTEHTLTVRVPGLRLATEVPVAYYLKEHLEAGGQVTLVAENVAGTSLAAELAEGARVSLEGPDDQNEYTFTATFISVAGTPMLFSYP